ncbi:MAG: asparagine synthase-related protein [Methylovulum sp.]|uniref:asparagine synthetase B family protein n=1 Tax=Methylovulum sp. TaxID=1916980 RepID=UPI00263481D0|nr:asparagine synthase-related protein [Methylovulum sp.]MDD2724480.1 asparagine synthase-related protein [Methylovulum sp.]
MSAIYGWLSAAKTFEPLHLLGVQRNAAYGLTGHLPHVVAHYKSAGLGGHGINAAPGIYEGRGLLVIVDGVPDWQDPALAAIAQHHDAAHALAEGFLQQGRDVLKQMTGAFAACVLQADHHYALLAVDRMGLRPLAYYQKDDVLVFGSQLDQILAHPDVHSEISGQSIFNYLYFHMIPSPGSIYAGIGKLQPGEFLEVNQGQDTRSFYWQRSYQDSTASKRELLAQLPIELELATKQCVADKQTGAFLSGGLDSSTVVGVFQKMSGQPVDAFSIGFAAQGYDEMEYARITARHFKATLHEYYVTPADVLAAIPMIAHAYDEPFGNASAVPAYYCAKFAHEQGMAQLLAGDGGDEIFAGNARYAKQKIFDLYRHVPDFAKAMLESLADNIPLLRKLKSYIEQAKIAMPERLETYNFLHRTPLAEIFAADFLAQTNANAPLEQLQATYQRTAGDDLIKKMLFLDNKFTLADNDLRKVNRMCELAGVDVKYPMLQENLLAFAASVPSKWLMEGFELRSFYRQGMEGFLAKETLAKSKQGFGLPFGVWMGSDKALKDFAEANLQGIAKRGFLNPAYITKLIQLHQSSHASYYGVMIWLLVMLEQWLLTHKV